MVVNDLISSGIHVWMLTGDKKETAHNIAIKINLVKQNSRVFSIDENPYQDIKLSYLEVKLKKLKNFSLKIQEQSMSTIIYLLQSSYKPNPVFLK